MDLLDLPLEIVSEIFDSLVLCGGVRVAVRSRSVCKLFDAEIRRAIWTTRALDQPLQDRNRSTDKLYADYLFRRTASDFLCQYHFTKVLHGALDLIDSYDQSALHDRKEAMRLACLCTIRSANFFHPLPLMDDPPNACSIPEHALALAAHLGLRPVVQTLIREGIPEGKTYFGFPLNCVAQTTNQSLVQSFLTDMLTIHKASNQASSFNGASYKSSASRGISTESYESAIRISIRHSTPEILYVIVDAAVEDRQFPRHWLNDSGCVDHIFHGCVLRGAAYGGRFDMVKAALDRGADLEGTGKWRHDFERTALDNATIGNQLEMVKFLVSRGALLYSGEPVYQSLLGTAAFHGHVKLAKYYLDVCTTDFADGNVWHHPIFLAAEGGTKATSQLVQMFLDRGIWVRPGPKLDDLLERQHSPVVQAVMVRCRELGKEKMARDSQYHHHHQTQEDTSITQVAEEL